MQASTPELFKATSLDIVLTQSGTSGTYNVSGKDAAKLRAKIMQLPEDTRDLLVGELKDGKFTLQKPIASSDGAKSKTTAKAG